MPDIDGSPARRHPRLQFSLKWLLAITTVAAVWMGIVIRRAREQQNAVRLIREQGGTVFYDFHENPRGSGSLDSNALCEWPRWFVECFGEDLVSNVVYVDLDLDSAPADAPKKSSQKALLLEISSHLPTLRKLRFLSLDAGVSDEALSYIGEIESLEVLAIIDHAEVTDGGVAHLARLGRLKVFALFGSSITDKGLEIVGGLHCLEQLQLQGSHVAGHGLMHLAGQTRLEYLGLGQGGGIDDRAIASLAGLSQLEVLDLSGANISSAGLAHLTDLKRLRVLNLSENHRFAEDGIDSLASLTALEELNLRQTGVNSDGMRCLGGLTQLRKLDLSDNSGVGDPGIKNLSRLSSIEELRLHNTDVSSASVSHLTGLRKLSILDLSENSAIDESAIPQLAKLASLTELDLHNTNCKLDAQSARRLRGLTSLSVLNLAGTGTRTAAVGSVLPGCMMFGSLAAGPQEYAFAGYRALASVINRKNIQKMAGSRGRSDAEAYVPTPETLPPRRILRRMLALTKVAELGPTIASRRVALEALAMDLGDLSRRGESLADESRRLVALTRSDPMLRTIYDSSVNLELADALSEHVEYLEGVRRAWALTDVEQGEHRQASQYLQDCLHDARDHLVTAGGQSPDIISKEAIIRIWEATAKVQAENLSDARGLSPSTQ